MELVLSPILEYCKGVQRAINLAKQTLAEKHDRPVYSQGQLIHNRIVCDALAARGLRPIESPEGQESGYLVVRAHGMTSAEHDAYLRAGYVLVDATCPVVSRNIADIARWAASRSILIIGRRGHAEVEAMAGVRGVDAVIISTPREAAAIDPERKWAAFVQTTFEQGAYEAVRTALAPFDVVFVNRICPASTRRRQAVLRLAETCDAVVVVGGRNSANTQALASLAATACAHVFSIEDAGEVTDAMRSFPRVGLAAGASTVRETIDQVAQALKEKPAGTDDVPER